MNKLNDEELSKLEKLKQKLYSRSIGDSASKLHMLKKHDIAVPTNWEDVSTEEKKDVKVGSIDNISHSKETVADFLNKKFENQKGDNFSEERAKRIESKIEQTTNALKLAQAELNSKRQSSSLYPTLDSEKIKAKQEALKENDFQSDYHPELNTVNFGLNADMQNVKNIPKKKKDLTFGFVIFMIIFFFFVGAGFYTYISLTKGTNTISTDKINIKVTGPVSVKSGEISDFIVDITNNNNSDLILSDLIVQYPNGSKSPTDRNTDLNNERISVGTIRPGETVRLKNSVIFFGEQNVKKNIKYSYEFNINDSSTVFRTEKDVGVTIEGSPISVTIENVKEINNNQEMNFDITLNSNSESDLKNIQLKVEYPFGFRLLESTPKPVADNNIWSFDNIGPLSSTTIRLKGKFTGEINVDKNFRFTLGIEDPKTKEILTILNTQDTQVSIRKPFVVTKLLIDGDNTENKPVGYSQNLKSDLIVTNNLNDAITDVVVEAVIGGVVIDRKSIKSTDGFYDSNKDVVIWDKSLNDGLSKISPGESRELSFNMMTLVSSDSTIQTLRRAVSDITINVRAQRLGENRVPENVTVSTKKQLRLKTDAFFNTAMLYDKGTYSPEVNKETVFKFVGSISNSANSLKDVTFTAKLPPNTTWKNVYNNIASSGIKYNTSTRELSINLGDIPAGSGIDKTARSFDFKVGFVPTLTQTGQTPVVIQNPTITATDSFTGENMVLKAASVTTRLTSGENSELSAIVK